jgi:lipoyl(octanoyl) transferase
MVETLLFLSCSRCLGRVAATGNGPNRPGAIAHDLITTGLSATRCEMAAIALATDVEWRRSPGLVDYAAAVAEMEDRAAAIRAGTAAERIWLLEHPPLYTAGTSARPEELLDARLPVHPTGRGGRYTYHGPGQRVGYVQLDLDKRGRDVRRFVRAIENWVIDALAEVAISARAIDGRVGIWVDTPLGEAKVGAIGIRVRRWVTMHGFSLNVTPNLADFSGIIPCGLEAYPVTSLAALGCPAGMADVDLALRRNFAEFTRRLGNCSEGLEGPAHCV